MNNYQSKIRDLVYVALFASLISVSGYISIPIPPVPVTAQTLVIMLAGSVLNVYQAGLSVLVFLFLGAIGAPVFSNGAAGIGVITGATGGYLIGFLAGAIVISLLKGKKNNIWRLAIANFIGGIIVVYTFGVLWLSFAANMSLIQAFTVGALNFIPGDLAKVALAAIIGFKLNDRLSKIR